MIYHYIITSICVSRHNVFSLQIKFQTHPVTWTLYNKLFCMFLHFFHIKNSPPNARNPRKNSFYARTHGEQATADAHFNSFHSLNLATRLAQSLRLEDKGRMDEWIYTLTESEMRKSECCSLCNPQTSSWRRRRRHINKRWLLQICCALTTCEKVAAVLDLEISLVDDSLSNLLFWSDFSSMSINHYT